MKLLSVILVLSLSSFGASKKFPKEVKEIAFKGADGADQPAKYMPSTSSKKAPLLVALHQWSGDYKTTGYLKSINWCIEQKWHFIQPNFRGPNLSPQAMGSDLVVGDILKAVEYAKKNGNVDTSRIYLLGCSGGAHAALLMAGRHPEIWAGATAWVGISDITRWHADSKRMKNKYHKMIEKSLGGNPQKNKALAKDALHRSPINWLKPSSLPLDINVGIHDGHTGSVPVGHSIRAFNAVAAEKDRISEADISYIEKNRNIPSQLKKPKADSLYGSKEVLFRRSSGTARLTIFDGGHEVIQKPALHWLEKQRRD